MGKYIGRSLAAAALAAATVVPVAGLAEAAPQSQTVAVSGDHGRSHHGRNMRHHRNEECRFFAFGRFGNEGREGHHGKKGHRGREHRDGCEGRELGLLGRILHGLFGWWF
ncbi:MULTISPECIES: hypothetical protein [unclassified Streptomyces]|uniref:hypothetical protein n=1 Tax=unclassified Streptomyces TaxID=2593676 RepID=UPI000C27E71F|nr:hypothetical protein [Streptomyces sp. CB02959]PJN33687.1 hypothetical protein CG747_40620 [Streptomyces sp. CB02959]